LHDIQKSTNYSRAMISALMIERNFSVFRMQATSCQRAGNSGDRRPLFSKLFLLQEYVICKMKNHRDTE